VKQDIKELVWEFLIEAFALVFHVEEMWMLFFEQFWFGTTRLLMNSHFPMDKCFNPSLLYLCK
jgi:hypothetical protein